MRKDDCFLMRGSKITEPMTVYYISDVCGEKMWAKDISIKQEMVLGFLISHEYDNNIPEEAVTLPANTWQWCKEQMLSFVEEINHFLCDKVIRKKHDITIGKHYVDRAGCVYTVTEIGEERIKYDLFRYDEDFISPCWTGDARRDDTDKWYTITDETYNKLLSMYDEFLSKLRDKLCRGKI